MEKTEPLSVSNIQFCGDYTESVFFKRSSPDAQIPRKIHNDDIGYDICLIDRKDHQNGDIPGEVTMFGTGLHFAPPKDHYFEMYARSSLHKTGYILSTGVSIIDTNYRGELLVPLGKWKETDDLPLPFYAVQLILKKAIKNIPLIEANELSDTSRGSGGFGSTDSNDNKQFLFSNGSFC
jgi:dUTP pyrophosphatase